MKKVEKPWGYEEWVVNDEYCGKRLVIMKGKRSSLHYHKEKKETFYVLKGAIFLEWSPQVDYSVRKTLICNETLKEGDVFTIEVGVLHRFEGLRNVNEIMEISTHHSDKDVYRLPGYKDKESLK